MSAGESIRRTRTTLGLTQVELAARAGISRQALGAIESGTYQPGVTVALALAHALGESVESLFGAEADDSCRHVAASWQEGDLSAGTTMPTRVALGRVGGKLVAVTQTAAHLMLAPGCGLLERAARHRAEVSTFLSDDEIDATLLVAGCDPAATILTDWLARHRSPISAISLPCSSGRALRNVVDGQVHAAGVHLRDAKNGEYNSVSVHRALGKRRATVIGFGRWELGLALASGNPLGIRGFSDMARPKMRIANREPGSGARATLDEELKDLGLSPDRIAGYRDEFGGHLEVAGAIAGGQADVAVTIRVAAEIYRLAFVPIREERYDLVILEREMTSAPVIAMLDALNSRRFAREVSQLCGYDTTQMGQVAAHIN
jgi:molybdopterin molybdotransferase/putative molybdopterin biosynthesis protein